MNAGGVEAAPWLAALFPAGVRAAWADTCRCDPADLDPAEAACLGPQAVRCRRQEFSAGRLCARHVLAELGIRDFPLLPAADRSPQWPPDCIGSLSHGSGRALAVAARRGGLLGLGVDLEDPARVRPELWEMLMTPDERVVLQQRPAAARSRFAALCFSAKEAFYKCQYPLTGHWLGFDDVSLEENPDGDLAFRVLARDWPGQSWRFHGRSTLWQGMLVCGVWAVAAA
ncbi:MAG: hypothetical protein RIR00_314 [Pseudomonadota bacterium]|jgi:4'-phosphopantetheinyl transferase EntD